MKTIVPGAYHRFPRLGVSSSTTATAYIVKPTYPNSIIPAACVACIFLASQGNGRSTIPPKLQGAAKRRRKTAAASSADRPASRSRLSSTKVFNLLFIMLVEDVATPACPPLAIALCAFVAGWLVGWRNRVSVACTHALARAYPHTHTHTVGYTHTAECTSSRLLGFTARIFMRVYVFESTRRGINCKRGLGGARRRVPGQ